MQHLLNWVEIPVRDLDRATKFYSRVFLVEFQPMEFGGTAYSIFAVSDQFNAGALVKGEGYEPRADGVVIYLNGGDDLSSSLNRVESAGGAILLPKTFVSDTVGHMAFFRDTEGNRIGLHSMG
jgi:predicted enzyme related to lactoylglutathione lyase